MGCWQNDTPHLENCYLSWIISEKTINYHGPQFFQTVLILSTPAQSTVVYALLMTDKKFAHHFSPPPILLSFPVVLNRFRIMMKMFRQ